MFVLQAVDTLLEYGANPSLRLSRGVGSALCAATSFMAERRRTPAGRIKLVSSQGSLTDPFLLETKVFIPKKS